MGIKRDGNYGTMHRILKILAWKYTTTKELATTLGVTRQAVHYHLKRLIEWGFVVRGTKECIMAICLDKNQSFCVYEERGKVKFLENDQCRPNVRGRYYVYSANYYIRKLFPSRPSFSNKHPPLAFIDIVKNRLGNIGALNEISGYDIFLMAGILELMVAVLWNPKPRGESYWVRLKHLTVRGIHHNSLKFMGWLISMKAAKEAKRKNPLKSGKKLGSLDIMLDQIALSRKIDYEELFDKYSIKYRPSLAKIRWILAKMYDYLMVERLGGKHCPFGIWVPHPSLFTPNGKPNFHLPRHKHINAKHRYKSLNVKRSFTNNQARDNQI